jgi:hypothetical protein
MAIGAGVGVPLFTGTWENGVQAERLLNSLKGFAQREMVPPQRRSGMATAVFSDSKRGRREVGAGGARQERSDFGGRWNRVGVVNARDFDALSCHKSYGARGGTWSFHRY